MEIAAPEPLQAIRGRIDAIDEDLHRLLIERSGVIDELIRIKGTGKPGAAFRPDREADMMRRIVVRHRGNLPIVTVEHIWREIITTFTAMQAPFSVAVGPSKDPLLMRDLVRFYFGFSVPVSAMASTDEALTEVGGESNALAVVSVNAAGRWWAPLLEPGGPKVFAKLPFIEVPDRPADVPAYVVGPPLQDPAPPDMQLLSVTAAGRLDDRLLSLGGWIAGEGEGEQLVELPIAIGHDEFAERCGLAAVDIRSCGGFAQPIRLVTSLGPQP